MDMWDGPGEYYIIEGLCRKTSDMDYNMQVLGKYEFQNREEAQAAWQLLQEEKDDEEDRDEPYDITLYDRRMLDYEGGPSFIVKSDSKFASLLTITGHLIPFREK